MLKIYDMIGREAATLMNGDVKAGVVNTITFYAAKLSSGVYVNCLWAGSFIQTKKLILLR